MRLILKVKWAKVPQSSHRERDDDDDDDDDDDSDNKSIIDVTVCVLNELLASIRKPNDSLLLLALYY